MSGAEGQGGDGGADPPAPIRVDTGRRRSRTRWGDAVARVVIILLVTLLAIWVCLVAAGAVAAMVVPDRLMQAPPRPGSELYGHIDIASAVIAFVLLALALVVAIAAVRSLAELPGRSLANLSPVGVVTVLTSLAFVACGAAYYTDGAFGPVSPYANSLGQVRGRTPAIELGLAAAAVVLLALGLAIYVAVRSGGGQPIVIVGVVLATIGASCGLGVAASASARNGDAAAFDAVYFAGAQPNVAGEAVAALGGTYAPGSWIVAGFRSISDAKAGEPEFAAASSCVSPTRCVVIGSTPLARATLETTRSGDASRWSVKRFAAGSWNDAAFADQLSCWTPSDCLAEDEASLAPTSNERTLFATTNGGRTWHRRMIPSGLENALFIGDPPATLLCGAPDWCEVTAQVAPRRGAPASKSLPSIVMLRTTDGGVHWTETPLGVSGYVRSISCPDIEDCTLILELKTTTAVSTHDGGVRWQLAPIPAPPHAGFVAVACSSPDTCVATGTTPGTLVCVSCGGPAKPGRPIVSITRDGGLVWRTTTLPFAGVEMTSASCAASDHCLLGGVLQPTVSQAARGLVGSPFVLRTSSLVQPRWTEVRVTVSYFVPFQVSCFSTGCAVAGSEYSSNSRWAFPAAASFTVDWQGNATRPTLLAAAPPQSTPLPPK